MLRLWHPDLTDTERAALQFTYDALELPALVGDDENARFFAERQVEAMRSFPEIKRAGGMGSGFGGGGKRKGKNKNKPKKKKGFGG